MAAAPKRKGRPSTYSDNIAAAICKRLARGESLVSICSDADMPCDHTVRMWRNASADFAAMYARAREDQADTLADEVVTIARAATNETAAAARVHLDAVKWYASKMAPKTYGEKQEVTHGATPDFASHLAGAWARMNGADNAS